MVSYTLAIGKNFLTEKHIEHNKSIVGYNAEEVETQYWVNDDIEPMMIEEMFFDSTDGAFTVTIINKKDDSLFISLTIPIEEWALKLAEPDLTHLLDNLISAIKKSKDRVDIIKDIIQNTA